MAARHIALPGRYNDNQIVGLKLVLRISPPAL
jgi:hypothetical protein